MKSDAEIAIERLGAGWRALFALARGLARLPYRWQMRLAHLLAWPIAWAAGKRRAIVAANIALCFPELDARAQARLAARNLRCTAVSLFETSLAWFAPRSVTAGIVQVEGLEHLQRALQGGKGALCLFSHFTMIELGGRLLSEALGRPMHQMVRRNNDPAVEAVIDQGRRAFCQRTLEKKDLGDLLRGYTDESGITVDAESVDWWQLFGSLHWAIICRQQAGRAGSGHDALELLAVGRRVAECEYDLLVELGLPMPASPPQAGDDDPDLFGEPTAADLLDAVGGFIAELADGASDRDRYRSKVAAHVLRIVARESQTGSAARTELGAHLARAGFETESGLALAIRDGSVDPGDADIAAAISTAVGLRLAVANPRYAS